MNFENSIKISENQKTITHQSLNNIPERVKPKRRIPKDEVVHPNQYAIISIIVQPELYYYQFAVNTVKCYSDYYNYTHKVIAMNPNPTANNSELFDFELAGRCQHTDIMFRRHCFFYEYLKDNKDTIKYALFLDADVFIVNPYKRIEDYIPKQSEEIIFYERLMNHEIACGSFIVKNTEYGRGFFKKFADYQYKMPKSMHGSDNAGIHGLLLEEYADKNKDMIKEREFCYRIWRKSKSFDDVFIFEACVRYVLAHFSTSNYFDDIFSFDNGRISIIKKDSNRRWIRDGIFSGTNFCKNDFLFHGFKGPSFVNKTITIEDINYDENECKTMPIPFLWRYKKDKMTKCSIIKSGINDMINSSRQGFWTNFYKSNYTKQFPFNKKLFII
uniref:Nucleotid_trans domain-containing protein n=1 Tax=Parastrongyloides trichosuri TaxID=131310 RepID=A0A0N4ZIJ3_PARTI